jgi:hypothetical protein
MIATRTATKLAAAALVSGTLLAATPAMSACFELIGCTDSQYFSQTQLKRLSCDALWTVRNTIFYENRYCFQTAKGQSVFSNAGCKYMVSGNVPLNKYERANVERVKAVEAQKGCR